MRLWIMAAGALLVPLAGCGGGGSSDGSEDEVAVVTGSHEAQVESVPVGLTFRQAPEAVTPEPFALFAFEANGTGDFDCQLDDGLFEPCSSPYAVYPLESGDHQFSVRLTEAAEGSEPLRHRWRVASIFPDEATGWEGHPDIIGTNITPNSTADEGWRGIFRINCDFAHADYNDPIVYPGRANAAHLHRFYGNTLVDENSDTESLFTQGESSCQGNALNRSAYWVPALLAPLYNEQGDRALDVQGAPAWQVVPGVVGDDDEAHELFYYSAGVTDLASIEAPPLGLRMIAGDHMAGPDREQATSVVRWHCQSWESSDADNPRWSTSIPRCDAPDRVRMDVFFPSCWNGVDLDAWDHQSHMAYPIAGNGSEGLVCPSTHPVPILRVSFHYAFGVKPDVWDPQTRSSLGWRLASDDYELSSGVAGGHSLHGDWFNAWYPEALDAVLRHCVQRGLDCHDGNLANGFRLSGTRPGTQAEPEIINAGHGDGHG